MGKTILVTGGAGFLGSFLCERLLALGNEVICMDNFSTGSKRNILPFLDNKKFELIRHDVTEPFSVEADEIYHLACPASPAHYQMNPVQTLKTCVQGTINALELAKRTGATILQASTSEVYGDPTEHPQSELYWGNVNPVGVRSCYDEGKRCAEALLFSYWLHYMMPIKIVRIFNTYGPGMLPNDGRVVSNFILQALKDRDITIYGDGSQTRSFCYRDDLVEAMIQMMATPEEATGPINIGNPTEFTILELANLVIELTGSKSRIVRQPPLEDDPKKRQPNVSLAKIILHWEATTPLRTGLLKTIGYFDRLLKEEPALCK